MPRRKKERGRPSKPYPPRIDATPEEALRAIFNTPPSAIKDMEPPKEYRCQDCERMVNYPEILYRDNRCEECHTAALV